MLWLTTSSALCSVTNQPSVQTITWQVSWSWPWSWNWFALFLKDHICSWGQQSNPARLRTTELNRSCCNLWIGLQYDVCRAMFQDAFDLLKSCNWIESLLHKEGLPHRHIPHRSFKTAHLSLETLLSILGT